MHEFNQFGSMRFSRTQPRQWRNTPFAGDTKIWPIVLRVVCGALMWLGLFGLSLWSIAQQVPQ